MRGHGPQSTKTVPAGPALRRPITGHGRAAARSAGSATSRPPDVCASHASSRSASSSPAPNSAYGGRQLEVRARAARDVARPRPARRTPGSSSTAREVDLGAQARRRRRPRARGRPGRSPVTSVTACGPAPRTISAASAFRVVIDSTAASTTSASGRPPLHRRRHDPGPDPLREDEHVARPPAARSSTPRPGARTR